MRNILVISLLCCPACVIGDSKTMELNISAGIGGIEIDWI